MASFGYENKAQHFFFVFLFSFMFIAALLPASQAYSNPRYASIVINANTGMVIHERYADKKLHPASLTKVMTLLMVFDELESNRLHMNSRIRISRRAASMVPSKLGLKPGSYIRVKDAIYAMVTKSANDVAVAIAEHIGRTESRFAAEMTRKAHALGMKNTRFTNASGLHDRRQVTTARDMAKMARYVINYYPEYYKFFSARKFRYKDRTYRNHNRLMSRYDGMDGMKTGYVAASGFNLIASAVRGNQRLIGIVFGGRSASSRNRHMRNLLNRSFHKARDIRLANMKVPVPPRKPALYAALASLNNLAPAASEKISSSSTESRWALLNTEFQNSLLSKIVGEGDYDMEETKRLETGLIAIAAHTGKTESKVKAVPVSMAGKAPKAKRVRPDNHAQAWSIQIGAFTSRVAADRAIRQTLEKMPANYKSANPIIVPLKTDQGWLFRGRLYGFNKNNATQACSYIQESCIPVSPRE